MSHNRDQHVLNVNLSWATNVLEMITELYLSHDSKAFYLHFSNPDARLHATDLSMPKSNTFTSEFLPKNMSTIAIRTEMIKNSHFSTYFAAVITTIRI